LADEVLDLGIIFAVKKLRNLPADNVKKIKAKWSR
jgi:hypothetical protein